MIEVLINGQKEKIAEGTTVADILQSKDIRPEMVAVEINGELIQKGEYPTLALSLGDQMEFLYYMAGGVFFLQKTPPELEVGARHTSPLQQTCGFRGHDWKIL